MDRFVPCLRAGTQGADDPQLRAMLAEANAAAGRDLGGLLLSLCDQNGTLLASWADPASRAAWSPVLTRLWQKQTGNGPYLHFIPASEEWEYDEDDIQAG